MIVCAYTMPMHTVHVLVPENEESNTLYACILQTLRDDKLSKKSQKMGPSWGLNPGPSEY